MNARGSYLRKERARLREYLKNRAGRMSQAEAYEKSWPQYRRTPRPKLQVWPHEGRRLTNG